MSTVSCPEYPERQDKLQRLLMQCDSLSLQVSVLTEQVDAQKEKIRDLEALLDAKTKLYSSEMISKNPSLANTAGLLGEISDLKRKFADLSQDKNEAERRLQTSHTEMENLGQSIQGLIAQLGGYQQVIPRLMAKASASENVNDTEQLRVTIQRLLADNEQKTMEINSLRMALDEQSRTREIDSYRNSSQRSSISTGTPLVADTHAFDINAQLRKLLLDDVKENISHSSSFPQSLCQSTVYPPHQSQPMSARVPMVHPSTSYTSSLSTASPQPSGSWSSASNTPRHQLHHSATVFTSSPSAMYAPPPASYRSPASPAARQLAAELDELRKIGSEIQAQNSYNLFNTGSLPRTLQSKSNSTLHLPRQKLSATSSGPTSGKSPRRMSSPDESHQSVQLQNKEPPGKNSLIRRLTGRRKPGANVTRSTSTPNLGRVVKQAGSRECSESCSDSDIESDDEFARRRVPSVATSTGKFRRGRARSTLRNIFGKLTRSTSQDMRQDKNLRPVGHTLRPTVSARLASSGPPLSGGITLRPSIEQFVDYTTEQVCEWMAEVGFNPYVPHVARYVRSGRHLLNMTVQELEKELYMKNPLHKKRLQCLLNRIQRNRDNTNEPADSMDVHQVMLWLDDIGLPQYRETFAENLIDGQMLLRLTAQDLFDMRIQTAVNHASLARGIQFLQSVDFCFHRLEKRFDASRLQNCPIPSEVEKWSHSCVVQWLQSIDLAEFTPNLMFSGIHGALMVHEWTFTAESLGECLQIPVHKTLLRRHLTTHFNNLLGQEIISRKRETLTQPYVTHLTPALKVKVS
ncbi:coiled-coil like protein 1 [Aphelenchoides avenae]|nr:coiled-coil like protein 1 [Aphelenchus avenae]